MRPSVCPRLVSRTYSREGVKNPKFAIAKIDAPAPTLSKTPSKVSSKFSQCAHLSSIIVGDFVDFQTVSSIILANFIEFQHLSYIIVQNSVNAQTVSAINIANGVECKFCQQAPSIGCRAGLIGWHTGWAHGSDQPGRDLSAAPVESHLQSLRGPNLVSGPVGPGSRDLTLLRGLPAWP